MTLIGGDDTEGTNPLTLLLGPLSYPELAPNFCEISPQRRKKMALNKHSLVRGVGWINALEIPVTALTSSPLRLGIFNRLRSRGPLWATFCDEWGFVEGGSPDLGVNSISKYLFKNFHNNYLDPKDQDTRFFTLFRAAGFIVFLHEFATQWFNDKDQGETRRAAFEGYFGVAYLDGFVFRTTGIEPIIYKVGTLGDAYDEQLMGVAWRAGDRKERILDSAQLTVNADFASGFKSEVVLPWDDDDAIDVDDVLIKIFVEERCADLGFMLQVADFSGKYFGTATPRVRAGSDFKGPRRGILLERFVDIYAPLSVPTAAPVTQQNAGSA